MKGCEGPAAHYVAVGGRILDVCSSVEKVLLRWIAGPSDIFLRAWNGCTYSDIK